MSQVVLDPGPLPVGPYDRRGASWWGVVCLIATEASVFLYLLFSYFYFDFQLPHSWRPAAPPPFDWSLPATIDLSVSAIAAWFADWSIRRNRRWAAFLGLLVAFLLGLVFLWLQTMDWTSKPFGPQTDSYGSLYFTTTAFHVAHVIAGLVALLFVMTWTALGYFDSVRSAAISNVVAYWYFMEGAWVAIFLSFYVSPYVW